MGDISLPKCHKLGGNKFVINLYGLVKFAKIGVCLTPYYSEYESTPLKQQKTRAGLWCSQNGI